MLKERKARNLGMSNNDYQRMVDDLSIAMKCEYTYENATIDLCATIKHNSPKMIQRSDCEGRVVLKYNIWNYGNSPLLVRSLSNEYTAVPLHVQNETSLLINRGNSLELGDSKSISICQMRDNFLTTVNAMVAFAKDENKQAILSWKFSFFP